jgi:hypothetical protein
MLVIGPDYLAMKGDSPDRYGRMPAGFTELPTLESLLHEKALYDIEEVMLGYNSDLFGKRCLSSAPLVISVHTDGRQRLEQISLMTRFGTAPTT